MMPGALRRSSKSRNAIKTDIPRNRFSVSSNSKWNAATRTTGWGNAATFAFPDERFHAVFGREHRFRIERPVIIEGAPRFQYSSYWFELAQPWPAQWAYTDAFYVDYIDGDYYMFDPLYPGMRIVVFVIE
jgi:hypothetical protein